MDYTCQVYSKILFYLPFTVFSDPWIPQICRFIITGPLIIGTSLIIPLITFCYQLIISYLLD